MDNRDRLAMIVKSIATLKDTIVFPVHPRTKKSLTSCGLYKDLSLKIIF